MKLSIVIPAYNEEAVIESVIERLASVLQGLDISYNIIVVDDGSRDRTWAVLKHLQSLDTWAQRLSAVGLTRNFGKEAAIVAGLRRAKGDAVVVMDADLQHPPELLPEMIEIWARGSYLVVEGVKRHRQRESLFRRLSAKLLYRILMAGASLDLRASTDYKLLDRCVVDAYLKLPETGRFFRGLTAWLGFPTAQLEITIPERQGTGTRWSLGALVNYARRTVVIFTALPLRSMSWVGIIGFSASVLMMLQTLWNKWLGHSEAGFPTVIILVLCMGSFILLGLGIVGEYLYELYNEVKRRPLYVVRGNLGLPGGDVAARPERGGRPDNGCDVKYQS